MTIEFTKEFAEMLEVNPAELQDDSVLHTEGEWDSIMLIATITLVDKYYGVLFQCHAINTIKTFGELKNLIATTVASNPN